MRRDFPERWPADTLTVLHGDVPRQLPSGDVFVVDPSVSCDLWKLGDVLEDPIVTEQDKQSPLMTHVRLDNVLMPRARQLQFKSSVRALASTLSKQPVYAEVERAEGKGLVLTVNLERSDLAFRTAFPIMVTNALGWFAGSSGELRESAATGGILTFEYSETGKAASQALRLRSPSGREDRVARRVTSGGKSSESEPPAGSPDPTSAASDDGYKANPLTLGPFDECGVWSLGLRSSDEASGDLTVAEFAVNLANQRESDLRSTELVDLPVESERAVTGWFARLVWFYLVAPVCGLTTLEWFLYQRRFIS